jgi:hypothetical protein
MSTPFAPVRSSTPPNTYAATLIQRSAVSDVSRSSSLSIAELARLTPEEIEFLDAVITRAPPSATTFIHIFKAYNDIISERGLDAENEVEYYRKLLKIGTLKGENWASKWRAVKAQNGYTATSAPTRTRPPLHDATPQARFPSKVTPLAPPVQSSTTARLLQRLKTLQHEPTHEPSEPSESAPDDLLSRTDVTDTEADMPPRATPAPPRGRPLSELTTTNNTLGLDVGATSSYPPSSTLAPSKAAGWRWPERDPDIDKSVPFLTSTPPLSPRKMKQVSRPTPVSRPITISTATRRSLADLRTPHRRAADEDDAWNKIRVTQDEQSADRFRNAQLLQRCFDVWKQGHNWIIVRLSFSCGPIVVLNTTSRPFFPAHCRQRQPRSLTREIRLFSASPFTSGAQRWHGGAMKLRGPMLAPMHIVRRLRSSVGTHTCRRGGRPRGALTCACECRRCGVCARQHSAGTRGHAGVSCTRAVSCSSALPCASSGAVSSGGRMNCEKWMR